MLRLRDLLLLPGLAAALVVGAASYRALAGHAPLGAILLGPPAFAIAPGLLLGAAVVGITGRSRLGAVLGGTAGAGLGGLHAGVAQAAGLADPVVMLAGGLASGLATYIGYRAILPPREEAGDETDA